MKIDLRDPAVWQALERQAYDGTVNLLPLPPPAYKYFSELTAVYRAFRFEGLSKGEAERKKQLLLREYEENVKDIRGARAAFGAWQTAAHTVGTLTSEIEKATTLPEIADLACRALGLLLGDESFYPRQKKKFSGHAMTLQEAHNEYEMLKGNVNRIFVTDEREELEQMYRVALIRLDSIRSFHAARLKKEEHDGE